MMLSYAKPFNEKNAQTTCKNIEQKGRTCEQFFNTFNRWYVNKKNIDVFCWYKKYSEIAKT